MNKRQKFIITTPEDIYEEAEAFRVSSIILKNRSVFYGIKNQEMNKSLRISIAGDVLLAYSIELYIKCLCVIENGFFYSGHNLLELFHDLSKETQEEISNWYATLTIERSTKYWGLISSPFMTFEEILNDASNIFIDSRYLFGEKKAKFGKLDSILFRIKNAIEIKRPDFKDFPHPDL